MRLNGKAFGLSCGILWGATVFLATLAVVIRGGTGELTGKLARYYIGYQTTIPGAFIGLVYAFIHAFIFGLIFVAIYNAIAGKQDKGKITGSE